MLFSADVETGVLPFWLPFFLELQDKSMLTFTISVGKQICFLIIYFNDTWMLQKSSDL